MKNFSLTTKNYEKSKIKNKNPKLNICIFAIIIMNPLKKH